MNNTEIYDSLAEIVLERKTECERRLNALEKSASGERRAIQTELGMYSLCQRAGLLYNTTGSRESLFNTMLGQANTLFVAFPKIYEIFRHASQDEKLRLAVALRAEALLRHQFLNAYEGELIQAKAYGDTDRAFELNIKAGAIKLIFAEWEKWRRENNIYPNMF